MLLSFIRENDIFIDGTDASLTPPPSWKDTDQLHCYLFIMPAKLMD